MKKLRLIINHSIFNMEDKEVVFLLEKHCINYDIYVAHYNGAKIRCRKSKIDGKVKYFMNSDLINSGFVKINCPRIAFDISKYEGKWMELKEM